MTAMTKTEIEKVVRKVLDEEQGDANRATLRAIERVTELLQERVIPNLPEESEEEAPDTVDEDASPDEDEASQGALGRSGIERGYSHQPCRKGGPTPADNALAAQLKKKLRGTMRGALNGERICCARQVVQAVKARRLHKRAAVIALTTTIVESTILNINKEYDHDSLGLFQQRASWGSRQNRLNPTWATNAFINAMLRKFPRNAWLTQPIGKVCQKVQVSAYPGRYQPQAPDAAIIVGALWGAKSALRTEEPDDGNATLRAIQRVAELLENEVIPRLSGEADTEAPDTESETYGTAPDETEAPDIPEEDDEEPPASEVPAAVVEAFNELYKKLSSEQAEALASLFTAIGSEPAEEDEIESSLSERSYA
jgi:hypothetical protein